jgi:predicted methyltransferase
MTEGAGTMTTTRIMMTEMKEFAVATETRTMIMSMVPVRATMIVMNMIPRTGMNTMILTMSTKAKMMAEAIRDSEQEEVEANAGLHPWTAKK